MEIKHHVLTVPLAVFSKAKINITEFTFRLFRTLLKSNIYSEEHHSMSVLLFLVMSQIIARIKSYVGVAAAQILIPPSTKSYCQICIISFIHVTTFLGMGDKAGHFLSPSSKVENLQSRNPIPQTSLQCVA
jgi:hypothetical protein